MGWGRGGGRRREAQKAGTVSGQGQQKLVGRSGLPALDHALGPTFVPAACPDKFLMSLLPPYPFQASRASQGAGSTLQLSLIPHLQPARPPSCMPQTPSAPTPSPWPWTLSFTPTLP